MRVCVCCLAVLLAFAAMAQESISGYLLGPDDAIAIHVLDGFNLGDEPVLIGTNGNITVPLIGRLKAGGLTVEQLETELCARLKEFIQEPEVTVTVVEFHSQPVSVLGAVSSPGVVQLRGRKTLYEVLSMAGGPKETAASSITVARLQENGPIPLPGAALDPTGRFFIAELDLREILDGKNPALNIEICPRDVITVAQSNARMIYIVGDVQHAGAFTMGPRQTISVMSAVSLAGGLGRTARPEKAKIFRDIPGQSKRGEFTVDLKQILAGKAEDVGLRPEDVLVVPTSSRKYFTTYVIPATIASAVAAAIYAGAHY